MTTIDIDQLELNLAQLEERRLDILDRLSDSNAKWYVSIDDEDWVRSVGDFEAEREIVERLRHADSPLSFIASLSELERQRLGILGLELPLDQVDQVDEEVKDGIPDANEEEVIEKEWITGEISGMMKEEANEGINGTMQDVREGLEDVSSDMEGKTASLQASRKDGEITPSLDSHQIDIEVETVHRNGPIEGQEDHVDRAEGEGSDKAQGKLMEDMEGSSVAAPSDPSVLVEQTPSPSRPQSPSIQTIQPSTVSTQAFKSPPITTRASIPPTQTNQAPVSTPQITQDSTLSMTVPSSSTPLPRLHHRTLFTATPPSTPPSQRYQGSTVSGTPTPVAASNDETRPMTPPLPANAGPSPLPLDESHQASTNESPAAAPNVQSSQATAPSLPPDANSPKSLSQIESHQAPAVDDSAPAPTELKTEAVVSSLPTTPRSPTVLSQVKAYLSSHNEVLIPHEQHETPSRPPKVGSSIPRGEGTSTSVSPALTDNPSTKPTCATTVSPMALMSKRFKSEDRDPEAGPSRVKRSRQEEDGPADRAAQRNRISDGKFIPDSPHQKIKIRLCAHTLRRKFHFVTRNQSRNHASDRRVSCRES